MSSTVDIISNVIGWGYILAWSFSFYPQAIQNYYRKSVGGFSLEFALLNPSGFFFYATYSIGGRVDNYLGTGTVTNQDLIFAMHAFALSSVQLAQIFMYDVSVFSPFLTSKTETKIPPQNNL